MIRAVLFDAVGTLIVPRPAAIEVYHAVAQRFGSRSELSDVRARFQQAFRADAERDIARGYVTSASIERQRWQQIVAATLNDVPDADQDRVFDELWQHFSMPTSWQLDPDLLPIWSSLQHQGLLVGIASNFDERLVSVCRDLPPLNQADAIFHSAQLGFRKPSIQFFRAIELALQLDPTELLLVGDDLQADYQGARQAGWHALLKPQAIVNFRSHNRLV